jgi:uncharacterized protein with NRDE domain
MCLLVVAFQIDPGRPLVVGANRDERFARPAVPMTVLSPAGPRILGGRDLRAGGTWLAVNEHGVVAGLTNFPLPDGADPARRSRGELPLLLTRAASASGGVEQFVDAVDPTQYNPCWMLVGDRSSLHYLDLSPGSGCTVRDLSPGLYVLENSPLDPPSDKAQRVRALLAERCFGLGEPLDVLPTVLPTVLRDHRGAPGEVISDRRPELGAACVHTPDYGTRSSALVSVGHAGDQAPRLWVAEGPPCRSEFVERTARWVP